VAKNAKEFQERRRNLLRSNKNTGASKESQEGVAPRSLQSIHGNLSVGKGKDMNDVEKIMEQELGELMQIKEQAEMKTDLGLNEMMGEDSGLAMGEEGEDPTLMGEYKTYDMGYKSGEMGEETGEYLDFEDVPSDEMMGEYKTYDMGYKSGEMGEETGEYLDFEDAQSGEMMGEYKTYDMGYKSGEMGEDKVGDATVVQLEPEW